MMGKTEVLPIMDTRITSVLLAAVLTTGTLVSAQETTGNISGRVIDAQQLAVPGVTVTVTGPQGARTQVTDNDGRYTAALLTPGAYTVRAELQGFRPSESRNVNVSLGQTVTVDMTLQVGAVTELVEVTDAPPIIDTQPTTVGATFDSELLARIPVGRRLSDTLYIAPGVSSSGDVGAMGRANPSIAGGSGLENQYVVDGVNITNSGYGALGSYSIVFGSLGNGVTFDFIKEVQVKSAGYEAEYGQ